jgi:hypothetical protein
MSDTSTPPESKCSESAGPAPIGTPKWLFELLSTRACDLENFSVSELKPAYLFCKTRRTGIRERYLYIPELDTWLRYSHCDPNDILSRLLSQQHE